MTHIQSGLFVIMLLNKFCVNNKNMYQKVIFFAVGNCCLVMGFNNCTIVLFRITPKESRACCNQFSSYASSYFGLETFFYCPTNDKIYSFFALLCQCMVIIKLFSSPRIFFYFYLPWRLNVLKRTYYISILIKKIHFYSVFLHHIKRIKYSNKHKKTAFYIML